MTTFKPGEPVYAGSTRVVFVKLLSPSEAIISVGLDTRIVDPVSLRKAS